jgi:hypothetical protein
VVLSWTFEAMRSCAGSLLPASPRHTGSVEGSPDQSTLPLPYTDPLAVRLPAYPLAVRTRYPASFGCLVRYLLASLHAPPQSGARTARHRAASSHHRADRLRACLVASTKRQYCKVRSEHAGEPQL